MLNDPNKGKIIIHVEKDREKINSSMNYRGIARSPEIALTTLLVNFVSLSLEKGKSPEHLIEKNLPGILESLKGAKKIKIEGGGTKPPPLANH